MANTPAYTGKQVSSALTKKGFSKGRGDHIHLYFEIDGKRTGIKTKVSHGRKVYSGGLWACLKDQLSLTSGELAEFLDCTLSESEYAQKLREKGKI